MTNPCGNGLSSANSASFSEDLGRLLENHVFLCLKRAGLEAFYFRGKGECDFIARDGRNSLSAIQSCLELNEDNKARGSWKRLQGMAGQKEGRFYILILLYYLLLIETVL